MNRKAKGNARENWLIKELMADEKCLYATRSSRSLGPYDVCAIMKEETWLIQVKTSHSNITTPERKAMERLSGSIIHRLCWFTIITSSDVLWQCFLDPENESGKQGWHHYPEGPFGPIGERVRVRQSEV